MQHAAGSCCQKLHGTWCCTGGGAAHATGWADVWCLPQQRPVRSVIRLLVRDAIDGARLISCVPTLKLTSTCSAGVYQGTHQAAHVPGPAWVVTLQWCAQKQAAAELKLLDDDAQQVLAMFASNMAEAPKPKPAQAGHLVAGRDITNLASARPQVLACAAGLGFRV